MNMETIKHYIYSGIKTYGDFLFNFCLNWLHHSPLKNLNEVYLYLFAGTIIFLFTFITIILPLLLLACLAQASFRKGGTFKEKLKSYIKEWKINKDKFEKEYPNSFYYKYNNQLDYIGIFISIFSSFLIKSTNFLWFGLPFVILAVLHNDKIKKKFNYEFNFYVDITLYLTTTYIALLIFVHFFVNYNLM